MELLAVPSAPARSEEDEDSLSLSHDQLLDVSSAGQDTINPYETFLSQSYSLNSSTHSNLTVASSELDGWPANEDDTMWWQLLPSNTVSFFYWMSVLNLFLFMFSHRFFWTSLKRLTRVCQITDMLTDAPMLWVTLNQQLWQGCILCSFGLISSALLLSFSLAIWPMKLLFFEDGKKKEMQHMLALSGDRLGG